MFSGPICHVKEKDRRVGTYVGNEYILLSTHFPSVSVDKTVESRRFEDIILRFTFFTSKNLFY